MATRTRTTSNAESEKRIALTATNWANSNGSNGHPSLIDVARLLECLDTTILGACIQVVHDVDPRVTDQLTYLWKTTSVLLLPGRLRSPRSAKPPFEFAEFAEFKQHLQKRPLPTRGELERFVEASTARVSSLTQRSPMVIEIVLPILASTAAGLKLVVWMLETITNEPLRIELENRRLRKAIDKLKNEGLELNEIASAAFASAQDLINSSGAAIEQISISGVEELPEDDLD